MKKIFYVFFVSLLSVSTTVYSQTKWKYNDIKIEKSVRDYGFFNNFFIGINGGATLSMFDNVRSDFKNNDIGDFISPKGSIYIGKYLTPYLSIRAMYEFSNSKTNTYKPIYSIEDFNRHSIFSDALFSFSTIFDGYKEYRKWNISPFVGIGYINGVGNEYVKTSNNIATRLGLQISYDITKSWSINLEGYSVATNDVLNARLSGMKYDIYSDLSLGIVYRFKNKKDGKKSFTILNSFDDENFSKLTNLLDNHDSVLKESKDEIIRKNQIIADQQKELAKLKEDLYSAINNKNNEKLSNPSLGELVVEFAINKTNIEEKQKPNIYLVSEMLKKNTNTKVTLVGYGDRGTGTDYVNRKIGWARAESVKSYLIKNGISEDRIKTISVGSDSQIFEKNNWNRAVAFVFSN